jgi:hypothetical protein
MNNLIFVVVLAALALVWYLSSGREGFVAEFIEHGNLKRTVETGKSSHRQETNHYPYIQQKQEPIQGTKSPFRVNIWNAYIP